MLPATDPLWPTLATDRDIREAALELVNELRVALFEAPLADFPTGRSLGKTALYNALPNVVHVFGDGLIEFVSDHTGRLAAEIFGSVTPMVLRLWRAGPNKRYVLYPMLLIEFERRYEEERWPDLVISETDEIRAVREALIDEGRTPCATETCRREATNGPKCWPCWVATKRAKR